MDQTGIKLISGCEPNHFGLDCKGICSLYASWCRGIMMCTNSYGCTCPPGITGPLCNKGIPKYEILF